MKKALVAITKGGYALGQSILKKDATYSLFTLDKLARVESHKIHTSLKAFIEENFHRYDIWGFIMATGIVVRLTKDLIQDKKTDPGIVVLDQKGKFAISLLSGHLGEANNYTQQLAKLTSGQPVITTASDVMGTISIDLFAKRHDCAIVNFTQAKCITAKIVNGDKILLQSRYPLKEPLPKNIAVNKEYAGVKGKIIMTNKMVPFKKDTVRLFKKNIVLGIGCRKDIPSKRLIQWIREVMNQHKLSIHSLKKIASVEIKKEEGALLEASTAFGVPFEVFSIEEIQKVEWLFDGSSFVKQTIGVSAVSEPCGYLASGCGKKLLKKQNKNGMTLSIWEVEDE